MSLREKLDSGIGKFYEELLRQRLFANQAAAQLDEDGNRPPEIRVGVISSTGRIRLEFTNPMSFPSYEEFVKLNERSGNKLIDIMVYHSDDEVEDKNLLSWAIVSVSP